MAEQETDMMECRACKKNERASEGYPCVDCGTFICLMCSVKGVDRCEACQKNASDLDMM